MTTIAYTATQVAAMSLHDCRALRDEVRNNLISADDALQRRATLQLLGALDRRIGKSPDERATDARNFLNPPKSRATTERAWAVAVELHGSEREAERRGYVNPGKAA